MMPRGRHPENVSPYTGLRVSVCKVTYTQEGEKLPTGGGEWPTFRTAHAQRTVRPPSAVKLNECSTTAARREKISMVPQHHTPPPLS